MKRKEEPKIKIEEIIRIAMKNEETDEEEGGT